MKVRAFKFAGCSCHDIWGCVYHRVFSEEKRGSANDFIKQYIPSNIEWAATHQFWFGTFTRFGDGFGGGVDIDLHLCFLARPAQT